MNKLNKLFLMVIIILCIVLTILSLLFLKIKDDNAKLSNELVQAKLEIENLKNETNDNTEQIEDNMILTTSSFLIYTSKEDSSISTNDLYHEDMSKTFTEIINSSSIRNKLYSKYGNDDKFIIESINEYNTMYRITLKTNNFDKNRCIEIHNEYAKEFFNLLPDLYNFKIYVLDKAS